MLLCSLVTAALMLAPPDTMPFSRTAAVDSTPTIPRTVEPPADTVPLHRRPIAVEYSDAYYTRLSIHRHLSYAIYPLYAAQYVMGRRLFREGSDAPTWAKTGHRVVATALVGVFAANTVTGLWNLWDSRSNPDRRWLRYTHAFTMLAADAAFAYAGSTLATQAQTSLAKRRLHRTINLSAIGATTASALIMLIFNR